MVPFRRAYPNYKVHRCDCTESVEINNCTNEEGKWNSVCTLSMEGRDFKRKKSSVRTGKIIRKTYFAIYNRKIFKGIYLFTQFGKLFVEKKGPEMFTGGNLFNIIIGELMFVYIFRGGGWGTVL